jgi:hypothetical protein
LTQLLAMLPQLLSILADRGAIVRGSIRAQLLSVRANGGSLLLQAVRDGRRRSWRIRRLLAGKGQSRHSDHPYREPGR